MELESYVEEMANTTSNTGQGPRGCDESGEEVRECRARVWYIQGRQLTNAVRKIGRGRPLLQATSVAKPCRTALETPSTRNL